MNGAIQQRFNSAAKLLTRMFRGTRERREQALTDYEDAVVKAENMTEDSLKSVWEALLTYDASEQYAQGVSMDEWCYIIHRELTARNIEHKL